VTLLSICQAACSTAPIAVPTSIVGNPDETATLLLALANDVGDDLARRPSGGWVRMIREYDFQTQAIASQPGSIANTGSLGVITVASTSGIAPYSWQATGPGVPNNAIVVAVTPTAVTINQSCTATTSGYYSFGQSDYTLPSDYERSVDNTFWDRSRYWAMRGPQSPQQWQMYKSSAVGKSSIERRYRFRSIAQVAGGFALQLSIDPAPMDNGSQLVFEYVSNGWCQTTSGAANSAWQTDTDTGVLDEYLMRLGLKWRLLRRLGLSYSEELDEFERHVDRAIAADGGAPVLSIASGAGSSLLGPYNLPESGYGGSAPGFGFGSGGFGGGSF
jgi:hypothetical protein